MLMLRVRLWPAVDGELFADGSVSDRCRVLDVERRRKDKGKRVESRMSPGISETCDYLRRLLLFHTTPRTSLPRRIHRHSPQQLPPSPSSSCSASAPHHRRRRHPSQQYHPSSACASRLSTSLPWQPSLCCWLESARHQTASLPAV